MTGPGGSLGELTILLGDFLRVVGEADNGGHAKRLVQDGLVTVNGEKEIRRARKLHQGDRVQVEQRPEHVVGDLSRRD